ncbi:hypothetical protein LRS13_19035 [Svornostia abyssi]|uniref:Uncharacterized protein n=1 Tax=Svornostia abyssi TaxID=2898438 RepID=A0ABY5PDM4_9ACTN|nr:hypothetical protein LRS13_19035 [Parviterribacteraceae bacterium J379]
MDVAAGAGHDLDLRADEFARDLRVQSRILRRSGVAQVLEPRDQLVGARIEERELLLEADREVAGRREDLARVVQIDRQERGQVR